MAYNRVALVPSGDCRVQVLQLASERQFVQALHARQLLRNDLSPLCIAREPIDDTVPRGSPPPHDRVVRTALHTGAHRQLGVKTNDCEQSTHAVPVCRLS